MNIELDANRGQIGQAKVERMKKMVNNKETLNPLKEPVKQARKVERDLLPSTPSFRQLPIEKQKEIEGDEVKVDP